MTTRTGLEAQALQIGEIVIDIFNRDVFIDAVLLQETVDLRVEFRSPRRHTLAAPAFWDGGRRFLVRFSPTERKAGPTRRPSTSCWSRPAVRPFRTR